MHGLAERSGTRAAVAAPGMGSWSLWTEEHMVAESEYVLSPPGGWGHHQTHLALSLPLTHAADWPTSTELPSALLSTTPGLQEQRSCSEIQWLTDRQQPGAHAGSVPEHAAQPNEHPESEL